jgi:hypothetical protein
VKSWLVLLSVLASCGYQWQTESRPTLSIPFAQGDEDGAFTAEVIRSLSASGLVDIVPAKGDYQLALTFLDTQNETIGYRIDPQKVDGKVRHNLQACEGRKTIALEATLYKGDEVAYGPFHLVADADYDYVDGDSIQDLTFTNPHGTFTVLPFSLGQLEPIDAAQEAAGRPLYNRLAQKVVDAISTTW